MNARTRSLRRHARVRALERYGLELGEPTRQRLIAAIRRGDSTFVSRTSLRVAVHDVDLDGETFRVAYDKQRRELVTFLPRS